MRELSRDEYTPGEDLQLTIDHGLQNYAQARLAGATEEEAVARVPKVTLHVLDVSFDAISDPKERAYFMDLPTSFVLPAEAVDRLREIAGRLLHQSPEYKRVVQELGGSSVE